MKTEQATPVLTAWDSAAYLASTADIRAYLDACFDAGSSDPIFLAHACTVAARAFGRLVKVQSNDAPS